MNIVFLSANKFGYEVIKEVIAMDKKAISAVITLNDSAKTIMYDKIDSKKWDELGIKIYRIENINDEIELLNEINPDLIMMCGWRQIINEDLLKIPKEGVIGFHPTLLPIGRGPAPIINSILNNFTESGLTMFYVSGGLDDGDIIDQEKFIIEDSDHASEVYEKVIMAGKSLIKNNFEKILLKNLLRTKQDENKVTVFEKPSLANNEINLNDSIEKIYSQIKALSKPYKGAYVKKDGKKLIIWRAELQK
ncbi:hypothetical protein HQ529_04855 [Candidatus Woesearchaeota archaeon]|nr:hypothetical protein [Candidatus Woesearchaeota archaeon]